MKKLIFLMIVLFFAFLTQSAKAEEIKLRGDLNFGYYSHYVAGTAGGLTIYDNPVFQQSFRITVEPWGFYAKLWSSYSLKGGFNSDSGDEVDYIIGIRRTFYDGKLGVDLSYFFYNLAPLGNTRGDLHAISLGADLPKIYDINPYISLEWDIPVDEEVLEGGLLYCVGGRYELVIPESLKSQTINFNLSLLGHNGVYGYKPELLSAVKFSMATTFKIWKVAVTPEINFLKGLGGNAGIADDRIWYGISLDIPLN